MSNKITPNTEQCIEFYFLQTRSKTGSLNVYATPTTDESLVFPLWTEKYVTSDEKLEWRRAQFPLGHAVAATPYQVVFEEHVPADFDQDKPFGIYLDDVFIRDESCLPAGDCDFSHGFCKIAFRYKKRKETFLMFNFIVYSKLFYGLAHDATTRLVG